MKIKELYSFSNEKQIWRLLPTETNKLIIEEREADSKEVFFNCLEINSGKKIFADFQLEEKFWTGIETIYKDIIYFHKFLKPDMPGHKDIIAYDIGSEKILWENSDFSFLFIKDDLVYCYKSLFEGKNYFTLDYKTGVLVEELGNNSAEINRLFDDVNSAQNFDSYIFPESYIPGRANEEKLNKIIEQLRLDSVISGKIDYVVFNNLLLLNYHEVLDDGKLRNIFKAFDIESNTVILQEILNKNLNVLIPDSFFIKDGLLFVLREKTGLVVYSLID